MKKIRFSILNLIVLCVVVFSNANAQSSIDNKESARIFVQKFYDWYGILSNAKVSEKSNIAAPETIAWNKKAQCFDASLRTAIAEDNRAQEKVAGEIVGLDFDPFLAAQDIGFAYQTGNVKQQGDKFFVDIHCDQIGKYRKAVLAAKVVVIAEVINVSGQWKFTNFIYPSKDGSSNLIHILKNLHKERVKSGYSK